MIKTLVTESFKMKYLTFGTGKKNMVIIPGISVKPVILSAEAIESQYARFAGEYTVYLFDYRCGMPDSFLTSDMAEDISAAMYALGITGAYILGVSHGGMISIYLAAHHPDLVSKLILGSSLYKQNGVSVPVLSGWYRIASTGDKRTLNRSIYRGIYTGAYYDKYADIFRSLEGDGDAEDLSRFMVLSHAAFSFDGEKDIEKIKCPVLVIGARQDNVLSCEASVQLAEALRCPIHIYENYGHAAYDEAPDYKDRIAEFFGN